MSDWERAVAKEAGYLGKDIDCLTMSISYVITERKWAHAFVAALLQRWAKEHNIEIDEYNDSSEINDTVRMWMVVRAIANVGIHGNDIAPEMLGAAIGHLRYLWET